jgi:hypothetical protein
VQDECVALKKKEVEAVKRLEVKTEQDYTTKVRMQRPH